MNIAAVMILNICAATFGQASNLNASKTGVIHGSGCVENAVETKCHVVIDSKTGDTYSLLFGVKAPKSGTAIRFQGAAHQGMSTCVQGKPVNVTSWNKEKGIKCPPPATPRHTP